jgi:hypothetical protein
VLFNDLLNRHIFLFGRSLFSDKQWMMEC